MIERFKARNERLDWCIVGEPSSTTLVGDVVKTVVAALGAKLTVASKAMWPTRTWPRIRFIWPPQLLPNWPPEHWDNGNAFFPPTSFQISNLNSGTGATNVIPGDLVAVLQLSFLHRVHR